MNKPNTTEEEFFNGTEGKNPTNPPASDEAGKVDYEDKFKHSQKGALDLLERNKVLQAELDASREAKNKANNQIDEPLYPGFENLSEDEQANMRNYTSGIEERVVNRLSGRPEFAESQERFNELKWDKAFNMVAAAYPDLLEDKEEFKAKNFQANNVPDNIDSLLTTLARDFLFDKSRAIGRKEAEGKKDRIDPMRNTGGSGGENQGAVLNKTLAEWENLAATDPAEFAKQGDLYDEDVKSGKLG